MGLDLRFELILFSLFSFVFSLESFRPRPRVHHFSFSSFFTFDNGAGSLGGTLGTFVTSPKARLKEVLLSEDRPVAEMRWMDGGNRWACLPEAVLQLQVVLKVMIAYRTFS